MIQVARDPSLREERSETAQPITVASQLAVFLLAVLPQVTRLFSMHGIPISQFLAAIFLSSSIVSMVRTLGTDATNEATASIAEHVRTSGLSESHSSGFDSAYYLLCASGRLDTSQCLPGFGIELHGCKHQYIRL